VKDIDQALETLLAIRGVEKLARDLTKTPEQAEVAMGYAQDVIEAIERLVTYLSITSRASVTPN
jgi:hypothetical protein